jgi:hypothetical protein
MPLQPQMIPVQLGQGIDTKTDPKKVQATNLLEAENIQFLKSGEISTRFGFQALASSPTGSATALAVLEDELVLFDAGTAFTYDPPEAAWVRRQDAVCTDVTDYTIIRNPYQQLNADVGYTFRHEAYAWEDSRGGVWGAIVQSDTRAMLLGDTQISSTGRCPKVITAGTLLSSLYILYLDGTNLVAVQMKLTTLGSSQVRYSFSTPVTVASGLHASATFDACAIGSTIYISYLTSAPAVVAASYSGGTLTALATIESTAANAYNGGPFVISCASDGTSVLWISWGTGTAVRTAAISTTGTSLQASTLVESARADTIAALVTNPTPGNTATSYCFLLYEVHAAVALNHFINAQVQSVGNIIVGATVKRGVGLASKPWIHGATDISASNAVVFVNVAFQSTLQSSYFTESFSLSGASIVTPIECAKLQSSTAQGLRSNGLVSEVVRPVTGGPYLWANGSKGKIESEANTTFALVGVNATYLDLDSASRFQTVTMARNLLVAGGILSSYDGTSFVECGYNVYPEGVTAVAAGSGGSMTAGAHQYTVTYEWTDARGQIQRSATSIPVSVTTVANDAVTVTVPTLRLTRKDKVRIVVYRTQAAGTTFNRVTSVLAPTFNDPTADTVVFVDLLSDASAAANELVYTTGGTLDNIAPPASSVITTHQGRVFVAGLEDPNLIWFSKNRFDDSNANTVPTEFSDSLTIGVDAFGGPITALANLDDKVVIFKSSAIFVLTGDGPTDTGGGNTYGDPTLLTSDVGCVNAKSVVATPNGIIFASAKGLYLLDRGTSVSYLGAPAEGLLVTLNGVLGGAITSAVLHTSHNQVIFTQSNGGATIVYDYYVEQWVSWTNCDAVSAVIWVNSVFPELVIARASVAAAIWVQAPAATSDVGAFIGVKLTTANISFAGLAGYQRAFGVWILGTFVSAHTLSVEVAYDDSATYQPTPALFAPLSSDGLYSYRVDFARQRTTSIRLRITTVNNGTTGLSARFSSLLFKVGSMPGANRLPTRLTKGAA